MIINADGTTIGPCSVQQGIQMAKDQGLDLVEVSPNTNPPVCKVLDYGKFKYDLNKNKKNIGKKTQTLKEIRMQPKISDHDLKFKIKHIQEFLQEGHKVKVTIRFKGRELAHTEIGEAILLSILEELACNFATDKMPSMEGRSMSMMLSPSNKSKKPKRIEKPSNTTPADSDNTTKNTIQDIAQENNAKIEPPTETPTETKTEPPTTSKTEVEPKKPIEESTETPPEAPNA